MMNLQNEHDAIFIRTPLIESVIYRKYCANHDVFMKMENLQPSGSFKLRGISYLCKYALSNGYTKVVCPSGGNAGLATAYAAMKLSLQCHIIVGQKTPDIILEQVQIYGATVERYGDAWEEAYHHAIKMTEGSKTIFLIHPFDHPIIWEGHSTMIDEIAQDLNGKIPSLIVTCCGGGGLACGIIQGVRRHKWETKTRILILETKGSHSFNLCAKNEGNRVRLDKIDSLASSLGANEVCEQLVEYYRDNKPQLLSRLVTDSQAAEACIHYANQYKFLIGIACATTIASIHSGMIQRVMTKNESILETFYDKKVDFDDSIHNGPIIIIICGGCEISLEQLDKYRKLFKLEKI